MEKFVESIEIFAANESDFPVVAQRRGIVYEKRRQKREALMELMELIGSH